MLIFNVQLHFNIIIATHSQVEWSHGMLWEKSADLNLSHMSHSSQRNGYDVAKEKFVLIGRLEIS